jgi:hypothetical protein
MGKPLVRFWEGQECNCDMDEILWHRRESRWQRRKQTSSCSHGSLLSTRKGKRNEERGSRSEERLENPQRYPVNGREWIDWIVAEWFTCFSLQSST